MSDRIFVFDYMMVSLMIVISILRLNRHVAHRKWLQRTMSVVHIVGVPLMLAAMAVRAGADLGGARYLTLLGVAASLWLLSALAWALFLVPKLLRAPRPEAA